MTAAGQIADRLRALQDSPSEICALVKSKVDKLIRDNLNAGRDVYGRTWKPKKDGSVATLRESGALLGSLQVTIDGTSVKISISDYKFSFHQSTRPLLTVGVMPESWRMAIEEAFNEVISRRR